MRSFITRVAAVALLGAAMIATTGAVNAATITVGGAGNGALGVTPGDTAPNVLVIGNQKVVPDAGGTYDLTLSSFNLSDQSTGGSVRPFIALYTGMAGEEHDSSKYDVVAVGDAYVGASAGAGVSVPFQAAAGTLTTSPGDVVVGGFYAIDGTASPVGWTAPAPADNELVRIIMQGTADVATDLTVTGAEWSATVPSVRNRVYQYDITLVPEPSTFALAGLALGGMALLRRRRSK